MCENPFLDSVAKDFAKIVLNRLLTGIYILVIPEAHCGFKGGQGYYGSDVLVKTAAGEMH